MKKLFILAALCAAMQGLPAAAREAAQDGKGQVVQDGIAVEPLKDGMWRRMTAPEQASAASSSRGTSTVSMSSVESGAAAPDATPSTRTKWMRFAYRPGSGDSVVMWLARPP